MTFDRVKRVLVEEMGCDAKEVTPDARLKRLGLDSMEMAQLVLELEDEFSLTIPDDDMQGLFTVEDVVRYADSHAVPCGAD